MSYIDNREWSVPFDHAHLTALISRLTERYPFLRSEFLGCSILDRSIPLLTIGNGRRGVLYVGTHHGMEWITAALLMRWVADICGCMETNARSACHPLCNWLDICTVYILPMLNPDGTEYQIHGLSEDHPMRDRVLAMNGGSEDFSHWQANARGVDLNHNYDAGFADYKRLERDAGILSGAPTRYSGEEAESEPEVRLLCNFIRFHTNLCAVLTLHTQGEEIYYSSGETLLPRAAQIAARLSALCGYRLAKPEGAAAYGGLTDWCIQALGVPSFTVECGKGVNPLPLSDLPHIYSDLRHALFAFPRLV